MKVSMNKLGRTGGKHISHICQNIHIHSVGKYLRKNGSFLTTVISLSSLCFSNVAVEGVWKLYLLAKKTPHIHLEKLWTKLLLSRPSVWHFRCTSSPPLLGFFLFRYTPVVVFSRYFHPGKKPWRINGEKREKWWWINCINVRETRRQKRGFGHSWQANRLFLGCWCCTVGNLRYKNFLSGVHFFCFSFRLF